MIMNRTVRLGDPEGFTLVELLIYMLLFGIVMTSIYSLFISNVRAHKSQENTMAMVQDLRGSIDVMVREIRMAGCDPLKNPGGLGFSNDEGTAGPAADYHNDADSIHFTMDIDDPPDGLATGANEEIVYFLEAAENKIMRRSSLNAVKQPLAEKISALTFEYYKADGSAVVNPTTAAELADIRSVKISITGKTEEIDPNTLQEKTRSITTWVRVRNAGL